MYELKYELYFQKYTPLALVAVSLSSQFHPFHWYINTFVFSALPYKCLNLSSNLDLHLAEITTFSLRLLPFHSLSSLSCTHLLLSQLNFIASHDCIKPSTLSLALHLIIIAWGKKSRIKYDSPHYTINTQLWIQMEGKHGQNGIFTLYSWLLTWSVS